MKKLPVILWGLMLPAAASAQELNTGDTAWILTSTALVLFMTIPGLSLFYAGLVRAKNVLSVLMQCFTITCLASIVWLIYGYSLSFSDGGGANAWIGGLDKAWLAGIGRDALSGTLPETVFVMFQLTFAIITPALIVGGFAERIKYSSMLLFSLLWLTVVYFPVCHWVWGGGWLGEAGLLDFAGGTVVHITAGVAALVAALVLKERKGFPGTPMPPHNLTLTVAGAGMLWVGWFGFNAGSAVASNGDAGMAMLVTHISAAAASLTWAALEWVRHGKPSVLGIVTGMVAGLGTITPASGFVGPLGALIIGVSAGTLCFIATNMIKRTFKIDDSLDVFPVHGVGGALGTILCGVFVAESWGGAGYAEGMTMGGQLGVQFMGVAAVLVWTAVATWIVLKIVQMLVGLRVDEDEETEGLDINQYDEKGYNL
ncbi:MAG: ammonium transporter [Gammaproteobacteria bacterium]|nr:ammonium transporter [Gammaproteobacteria bacterium]MDD9869750.1 ammonium transporter [Gammaproteobacteria bacterium]MDD9886180.1 ammonium transporter [Gammaproteobacteria bacterium]